MDKHWPWYALNPGIKFLCFSDHCLVTADMKLREGSGKTEKGEIVERTYYRRDE